MTAPDQKYDDYAGVDVHGKLVVDDLRSALRISLYRASLLFRRHREGEECGGARSGRACCRSCCPRTGNVIRGNGWFHRFQVGEMHWLDKSGIRMTSFPELRGDALFSEQGAALALCRRSQRHSIRFSSAARASKPQAFALPVSAHIHTVATQSVIQSSNIVAELKGSDPALRDQYVVYTAHVDHLGICPAVEGDNVCHGALDNASGTSTLLEIARAYASLPQPPRRSVLFVFVTGRGDGAARFRLLRALSHRAAEVDRGQRQHRRRSGQLLPYERCSRPGRRALNARR